MPAKGWLSPSQASDVPTIRYVSGDSVPSLGSRPARRGLRAPLSDLALSRKRSGRFKFVPVPATFVLHGPARPLPLLVSGHTLRHVWHIVKQRRRNSVKSVINGPI